MKIVVLDAQTVGEDVDWSGYEKLGEVFDIPILQQKKCRNG